MPLIILGASLALSGVAIWLLSRHTAGSSPMDADPPGVVGMSVEPPRLPTPGDTLGPAEGEQKTGTVPTTATESMDGDKFASSDAAYTTDTLERWTADAFDDEEPYVPGVELSTQTGEKASPVESRSWVLDDVVSPRDLSENVLNPDMGSPPGPLTP